MGITRLRSRLERVGQFTIVVRGAWPAPELERETASYHAGVEERAVRRLDELIAEWEKSEAARLARDALKWQRRRDEKKRAKIQDAA